MNKKIYIEVDYSEKTKAKESGAFWDPEKKKWYCYDNELFLLKFTGLTKLQREKRRLLQNLGRLYSDLHFMKDMNTTNEIYRIQDELKQLDEKIKNDHDIKYYLEHHKYNVSNNKMLYW